MRIRIVSGALLLVFVCAAYGWDERGHVIVTRLAVGGLPEDFPAWVRQPESVARLAYLANEPDRWRGLRAPPLDHWNKPDHYMDVEHLTPYGLSLKTLPRFRYEFVGRLAAERALHPDRFPPADPKKDKDRVYLTPGMLPYRMYELYAEAASSWSTLKMLEDNADRAGPEMIAAARERVLQSMGLLSHYVGDAAQPLHTTEHHNGWVGANPNGYTARNTFHAYIDGGVLMHHAITSAALWDKRRNAIDVPADHVWEAILDHIDRAHRNVEPLYKLEKSGELNATAGKEFIEERLLDGGAMLSGLWVAAYRDTVSDSFLKNWLRHKERRDTPPSASQPASRPAATQSAATQAARVIASDE